MSLLNTLEKCHTCTRRHVQTSLGGKKKGKGKQPKWPPKENGCPGADMQLAATRRALQVVRARAHLTDQVSHYC